MDGLAWAVAPIVGIVLSTQVTLVLVPVFYVLIERLRGGRGLLLRTPDRARLEPRELMVLEQAKTGIIAVTKEGAASTGL